MDLVAKKNEAYALEDLKNELSKKFEEEKINIARDNDEELAKLRLEKEKLKKQIVDFEGSVIHGELGLNILKMSSSDNWEPSSLVRDHETWLQSLRNIYLQLLEREKNIFDLMAEEKTRDSTTPNLQKESMALFKKISSASKTSKNTTQNQASNNKNKIGDESRLGETQALIEIRALKSRLAEISAQETNLAFALQANNKNFHRHFGNTILQRWHVQNVSNILKDLSVEKEIIDTVTSKVKSSLSFYTESNQITVNAYILEEEKKIEEAIKDKNDALEEQKEALVEKEDEILKLNREIKKLNLVLEEERKKSIKAAIRNNEESKMEESLIESKADNDEKSHSYQKDAQSGEKGKKHDTIIEKLEEEIKNLKLEVAHVKEKAAKSNYNVNSMSSMEGKDDEDADGASIKGYLGIVNKPQQKDTKVQALQNYVIEKLNEEISDLRLTVEKGREEQRQMVHIYESKITKLEESKVEFEDNFNEQQDHYWFGCGKCQRQVDEAQKKCKLIERQYNQLLMQQSGR